MANDFLKVPSPVASDEEKAGTANDVAVLSLDAAARSLGVDVVKAENDAALELLVHSHIEFDPESEIASRVKRKIDWHIMPFIVLVYLLQLTDKNALSYAAIFGIKTQLGLTGGQYSSTVALQRVNIRYYFSLMTVLWGIVVGCHAACKSYASLAVVRFLLGTIEVVTVPAVFFIISAFYTKREQIIRVGILYTCSGTAQIVGGFLAFCLLHADTFRWQGIYILYGGLTIITGVLLFLFIAGSPPEAHWLTEEEKIVALERVRVNKAGSDAWPFNASQLWESFRDPRFYLIFLLLVSTGLPNGGFTAFGPTIVDSFGFTLDQTTLLGMAPGAAQLVTMFLTVIIARYTTRAVAGIIPLIIAIIGFIVLLSVDAQHNSVRYGGYVLSYQFPVAVLFVIAWQTSSFGGSTKKFAMHASYGFACGNIIGPQTYQARDAPNYAPAKYTALAFTIFAAVLILAIELLHLMWNKRRDARDAEDEKNGIPIHHVENEEFYDLTDFQLRSFRYPL